MLLRTGVYLLQVQDMVTDQLPVVPEGSDLPFTELMKSIGGGLTNHESLLSSAKKIECICPSTLFCGIREILRNTMYPTIQGVHKRGLLLSRLSDQDGPSYDEQERVGRFLFC